MIPVTDGLPGKMVRAIVDEVDPEQVILFGSRARGDDRKNSDVDFIVVEAEPFGPERSRHKELVRLYHALAGFRIPADVLVYSHDDVDYWRDSLNHVLARALREGKVLHERRQVREDDDSCGQIGIGCEKLFRRVVMDSLELSEEDVTWSYRVALPSGRKRTLYPT